jgi:c-di-GMP-binding flagellar brake protein YcgR
VGSFVDVNLETGNSGEPITISCEVVWIRTENSQPVGCGCRFSKINDIQAAQIRRLMDEANREPLFYDV